MTSQGFSFPPPPPPPPTPPTQQHPPQYSTQYAPNYYGQRGDSALSEYQRGRGRGGTRGGHLKGAGISHPSPSYQQSASAVAGYPQVTYASTAQHPHSQASQRPPPYVSAGIPRHGSRPTVAYTHQSPYAPALAMPPFPQRPNLEAAFPVGSTPQHHQPAYPPQASSSYVTPLPQPPQRRTHTAQPAIVGPPMRWGFEAAGGPLNTGAGTHRGFGRGRRMSGSFGPAGDRFSKHANKRNHGLAFGPSQQSASPRVPAPSAVPSFGNPALPTKPPTPATGERKPKKKKKRKHNQLGLTPKTDEHESSEEEDYVDEEAKLTQGGAGSAVAPLQFTYRGRTSTLQSPEEIAAWIEERKKRYPTQARIEEKKKALDDAKKAREEALRVKEEKKQEAKRAQDVRVQKERDDGGGQQEENSTDVINAAERAQRRAEKLRRKLAREERRVAKAEAEAQQARLKAEEMQRKSSENDNTKDAQETTSLHQESHRLPETRDERTQASQDGGSSTLDSHSAVKAHLEFQSQGEPFSGTMNGSSDSDEKTGRRGGVGDENLAKADCGHTVTVSADQLSGNTDWTSTSGIEDSSSDTTSEDDSAPEAVSSRLHCPERVSPPRREGKKTICHHFAKSGHCLRGKKCRFSHDIPGWPKGNPLEKIKGRKGLLQALLDRQNQDEDYQAMQAIVWLGENGMLEEPNGKASKPALAGRSDGERPASVAS